MLKNLMSGLVGVAAILAIYGLANFRQANGDKQAGPFELPHATIVVDGVDLSLVDNRTAASSFERELADEKAVGFSGLALHFQPAWGSGTPPGGGPEVLRRTKVLLPGKEKGDPPVATDFGNLSDETYAIAAKYFRQGDYIIPRVIAPDGAGYVLRCAPKDPRKRAFDGDALPSLKQRVQRFSGKGWKTSLYSRALGVGGEAERNATNASFGVQTTWVRMAMEPGSFFNRDALNVLENEKKRMREKEGANIRSVTTPASWVRYYWSVRHHITSGELELPDEPFIKEAFEYARREGFHPYVTADGALALIDVTTDLEGEELERLTFRIAQPLGATPHAKVFFYTSKNQ